MDNDEKMQNLIGSQMLADYVLKDLNRWVEASKEYYTGEAIMSDPEFDELQEKLINYNIPILTEFIQSGIYRNGTIEEVTEYTQEMISLFKIKYKDKSSITDIKKYLIYALHSKIPLYYGPKLDGAALKIVWEFSENIEHITQIQSRGGLDVTRLFMNHPNIIATKKYRKNIVCGELVIKKTIFIEQYSDEWENPRNFVGKLLKQKTIEQSIINNLNFIPCTDGINKLNDVVWKSMGIENLYNLENLIKEYKSDNFPFLCDGIVIAYDTETRIVKDNYPLNMVAIKFPGQRAKTTVIDFEYTQKKSGKLTPMVLLKPVELEGITITKANGYNYQNVIDNHIGIGSEVEVEKSGDIIPVVAKVLTYSKNVPMPKCEYIRSGKHLIAVNLEESRKYKFILGLKLLNIDGIGDTLSEKIGEIVKFNILDLFDTIYKPQIYQTLGGGSNWKNFSEFYNIKSLYLDQLIAILQFNGVGPVLAKKIALLITKKSNDTANMSSDIISNICRGEGFVKITDAIKYLQKINIKVNSPIEINEDTITFEMTGNPPNMTKDDFVKKLKERFPNSIHEALKKDTKYLFCDNLTSNTSKCNKARKYNIKTILYIDALNGKI